MKGSIHGTVEDVFQSFGFVGSLNAYSSQYTGILQCDDYQRIAPLRQPPFILHLYEQWPWEPVYV